MNTMLILIIWILGPLFTGAQSHTIADEAAMVRITGTSTLHDWSMETARVTGTGDFVLEGGALKSLSNVTVTIDAETLKSEKSAMDKNAYKALKTDAHPSISFKLSKVNTIRPNGKSFDVVCEGVLKIAGQAKTVQLAVTCTPVANGGINCQGNQSIDMTEFGVEPPSFMFGSVKTGKEITIAFNVVFAKS